MGKGNYFCSCPFDFFWNCRKTTDTPVICGRWKGRDPRAEIDMTKNRGLSFYKRKKKISPALVREIFSWIFGIGAAVFIAVVLNIFLGGGHRTTGS